MLADYYICCIVMAMSLTVLFLVPFIGTLLGSAAVYFFHKGIGIRTGKVITGFAGGVMIAASVWSLLLPAIDESSYYTAAAGFLLGIAFLLLLDTVVPHIHATAEKAEGKASGLSRSSLLMLAVTLHNIPEGIAVSVPIYQGTGSRKKAFVYSFLSGLAEPLGALIGFLLLMPFMNGFVFGIIFALVAGIMVFISFDELLPAAREYGEHHLSIYGLISGMIVMALSLLLLG